MKIISEPIEIDRRRIDSLYRFAIAVAQRAKQLNEGAMPMKETKTKKITTLALEEVASDNVRVLSGEEAVIARKEAEKFSYDNMIDDAGQKKTHIEDMSGLEKNIRSYLKGKRNTEEEYFPWNVFDN